MRWLRDWLSWAAAWTLVAQAPMWVRVGFDILEERRASTLDATPVADWIDPVALVPAVVVPLAALLAVAVPLTHRVGLGLGAVGLGLAAWSWTGFADGDVGPWYVGLTGAAALVSLTSAVIDVGTWSARESERPSRVAAALAGIVLGAGGAYFAWTCLQGGDYWHWTGERGWTYAIGVAVGALLTVAGATAVLWRGVGGRVVGWLVALVIGAGALLLLVYANVIFDSRPGTVYRWDEHESPWAFGTPASIAGTGLLAGAVAAARRRGDLLALSVGAGIGLGVVALWHESTWGSVMG